ncbi:MAG: transporter substrate-binding domain-containing protein [Hyphomicrobium sp.]|nr:transporter substrate-binding domain-containing protein [Hyphomicrobium sp.]
MGGRKSSPGIARLAVVLTAALTVVGPAVARPLDEVTASGTLNVVAYVDNAPFSYDDNGTARGIDVDLAHALARELGVKAEIVLRMQGEEVDDDLRANVWKGPLTGGIVGDLMLHVPVDRDLALRNREVVIGNAYFEERVGLAIHPELTGDDPTFDVFLKDRKVGVQLATVSDYFLMTYKDGALIPNIAHHLKAEQGAKEFAQKDVAALMGVRSKIEALLAQEGVAARFVEPDMTGIVRRSWLVGMAWKENSRDLGYAVQAALEKIQTSGELEKICKAHGVAYTPPPPPK